jgi:hypothetical protein
MADIRNAEYYKVPDVSTTKIRESNYNTVIYATQYLPQGTQPNSTYLEACQTTPTKKLSTSGTMSTAPAVIYPPRHPSPNPQTPQPAAQSTTPSKTIRYPPAVPGITTLTPASTQAPTLSSSSTSAPSTPRSTTSSTPSVVTPAPVPPVIAVISATPPTPPRAFTPSHPHSHTRSASASESQTTTPTPTTPPRTWRPRSQSVNSQPEPPAYKQSPAHATITAISMETHRVPKNPFKVSPKSSPTIPV